jgi:hypothetical protein
VAVYFALFIGLGAAVEYSISSIMPLFQPRGKCKNMFRRFDREVYSVNYELKRE